MSKIIESIGTDRDAVVVVKRTEAPRYEVCVKTARGETPQAILLTDDVAEATRELVARAWASAASEG